MWSVGWLEAHMAGRCWRFLNVLEVMAQEGAYTRDRWHRYNFLTKVFFSRYDFWSNFGNLFFDGTTRLNDMRMYNGLKKKKVMATTLGFFFFASNLKALKHKDECCSSGNGAWFLSYDNKFYHNRLLPKLLRGRKTLFATKVKYMYSNKCYPKTHCAWRNKVDIFQLWHWKIVNEWFFCQGNLQPFL